MKLKLLIILLLVSILINFYQALVINKLFVVQQAVDFWYEIPEYSEREQELIRQATSSLMEYSEYPNGVFISAIEETDEEILFRITPWQVLRNCTAHIKGIPFSGMTYHTIVDRPGAYQMSFDKNMRLKRVDNNWRNDLVFDTE